MKKIKVEYMHTFIDCNKEKIIVFIDNNDNKYFKRKNYIKGIFSHGIFCQASK